MAQGISMQYVESLADLVTWIKACLVSAGWTNVGGNVYKSAEATADGVYAYVEVTEDTTRLQIYVDTDWDSGGNTVQTRGSYVPRGMDWDGARFFVCYAYSRWFWISDMVNDDTAGYAGGGLYKPLGSGFDSMFPVFVLGSDSVSGSAGYGFTWVAANVTYTGMLGRVATWETTYLTTAPATPIYYNTSPRGFDAAARSGVVMSFPILAGRTNHEELAGTFYNVLAFQENVYQTSGAAAYSAVYKYGNKTFKRGAKRELCYSGEGIVAVFQESGF